MSKHAFISLILTFFSLCASAMQTTGEWKIYPIIDSSYQNVIDTSDKVYFLSAANLYSYDKKSHETYFYNIENKLSGSEIKEIHYNPAGHYLLIIYSDSNMDLLYDDGRCVALPEIKNATSADDKTINDIAFGKGRIVIATNFGLVVYDDVRHEVVDSGNYRQAIKAVAVVDDQILIYYPWSMLHSPITDRHNSIDKFTFIEGTYTDRMLGINDNTVAWVDLNNNMLMFSEIDFKNHRRTNVRTGYLVDSDFYLLSDGTFWFRTANTVYVYDNKAELVDKFVIPDSYAEYVFGFYGDKSSVWFAGPDGTTNVDLSDPSSPVVLSDWYRPEATTVKEVVNFFISPDGHRIYLSNLGSSITKKYISPYPDGVYFRQFTDVIEDGEIRDISLINASATASTTIDAQKVNQSKAMFGGVTRLVEDPEDPDTYFIGNAQEGVYVVTNREEQWKFNIYNSPFKTYWNTRVYDVNFDQFGNLWVGHAHNTAGFPPYIILPAEKLRQDFDKIKKTDWVWPSMLDFNPFSKDFTSLFCRRSPTAFFLSGNGYIGLYVMKTTSDFADSSTNTCYNFNYITDQDGNTFQSQYIFCFEEDLNGDVWVGTTQGLFYFSNPKTIDENTTVVRPKVPRNDGTNFADYLLESEQINAIATDNSNRKWIATEFSGVYLVSARGDKIIQHFDTSNSPLPSNQVISVICDPHSNTVYFGTTRGLISYKSDSSPAHDDFSEVYAYPNPVRPDYTGPVTVTGLMENSLVKIADAAGNTFFQGRSEGGMVTWDVCNMAGERVKSGIYFVYVSSGSEGTATNGSVAKIMVIN